MRFERYKEHRARGPGPVRLVVLAGLLLGVILAMWRLQRSATAPQAARGAAGERADPSAPIETDASVSREALLDPEEERALLRRVQDQYDLAVREQKEAYYYLLKKVRVSRLDELEARLDRTADSKSLIASPGVYRGATLRVRGQLYRLDLEPMDRAASGFSHVYEGMVRATDGTLYTFVLVEEPPAALAAAFASGEPRIPVELTGVFLQHIVYRGRRGDLVATPLVIAKELRRLPPPPDRRVPAWLGAATALAVAAVGFILLRTRRRKHEASSR